MKECPECTLINPDTAKRCDCGYDFETKILYANAYYREYRKRCEESQLLHRVHSVKLITKLLKLLIPH